MTHLLSRVRVSRPPLAPQGSASEEPSELRGLPEVAFPCSVGGMGSAEVLVGLEGFPSQWLPRMRQGAAWEKPQRLMGGDCARARLRLGDGHGGIRGGRPFHHEAEELFVEETTFCFLLPSLFVCLLEYFRGALHHGREGVQE